MEGIRSTDCLIDQIACRLYGLAEEEVCVVEGVSAQCGTNAFPLDIPNDVLLNARNIRTFRCLVKRWGRDNLRDFPWRHSRDPYEVVIAELMLRRTQARQVAPTYEEFVSQ